MPEEAAGAVGLTAGVAERAASAHAVESPGLSTETGRRLEDTLHRAARAAFAPAPTVATAMAARPGAIPHAAAPVWGRAAVEVEELVAVEVPEGGTAAVDVASPTFGRPGLGVVPGDRQL